MWKDALKVDFSRFLLMRQYYNKIILALGDMEHIITCKKWLKPSLCVFAL